MILETTNHAIRALCCRLYFGQETPQGRLPFGGIETARQVPMFAVDLEITRVHARLLGAAMTPGAIEGEKCASVRDKTKRSLDLIDPSFGCGSKRIMALAERKKRVGVETFGPHPSHIANLGIARCPFGKGLLQVFLDSVASEGILSQVDKRVDHTHSRLGVAAVPVGISSQH